MHLIFCLIVLIENTFLKIGEQLKVVFFNLLQSKMIDQSSIITVKHLWNNLFSEVCTLSSKFDTGQKNACLCLPDHHCYKVPTLNFFWNNLQKIIDNLLVNCRTFYEFIGGIFRNNGGLPLKWVGVFTPLRTMSSTPNSKLKRGSLIIRNLFECVYLIGD